MTLMQISMSYFQTEVLGVVLKIRGKRAACGTKKLGEGRYQELSSPPLVQCAPLTYVVPSLGHGFTRERNMGMHRLDFQEQQAAGRRCCPKNSVKDV